MYLMASVQREGIYNPHGVLPTRARERGACQLWHTANVLSSSTPILVFATPLEGHGMTRWERMTRDLFVCTF